MNNLVETICRLWWIEAGVELKNPRSKKSILALERVLRREGFEDIVIDYVIETIVRTPQEFKDGEDEDTGVYVDDDETAVSAKLDDEAMKLESQLSEFNEEEADEEEQEKPEDKPKEEPKDEKGEAEDDIKTASLTALEKEKMGIYEIDDSKMVSNPNPKGRKPKVTYGYAKQWLDDNPGAEVSDEFKKDTGGDDDEEPTSDVSSDIPQDNGYVGSKDKTLKQGDPRSSDEYQRDLPPSDEEFNKRNEKLANPIPPEPYSLPSALTDNPKFPKKYVKALERMMNTQPKGSATKWQHYSDIPGGAGQISAQAGELMTMMGTAMSDDEFNEFTDSLLKHEAELIKNNPDLKKESKRIITKSWVEATKQSRNAIRGRLTQQYGEGTEIIASAWDTESDVEALGLSDYKNNKGFSTDMYLKVRKPDGTEVLDEISLKKSTKVNFLNSGAGSFKDWDENLPDNINQNVYRDNQRNSLSKTGNKLKSELQNVLSDADFEKFNLALEDTNSGKGSRAKSKLILKAIGKLANDGNDTAIKHMENVQKQHREFQKNAVKAITENPKMKEGMLNTIRSEFPLKAVSDGEETMAIGPNSLDKNTMKQIFGTDDYNKLKENLVAKSGPPPFIGYNVESTGEVFPVAEVKIREDGVGYGGQIKVEMTLHKEFAPILENAHKEVYK